MLSARLSALQKNRVADTTKARFVFLINRVSDRKLISKRGTVIDFDGIYVGKHPSGLFRYSFSPKGYIDPIENSLHGDF